MLPDPDQPLDRGGTEVCEKVRRGLCVRFEGDILQGLLMTDSLSLIEKADAGFHVFYNPACLEHDTGPHHPERRARLEAVFGGCAQIPKVTPVHFTVPPPAGRGALVRAHDIGYLQRLEESCLRGDAYYMSSDNPLSEKSCEAILASAGLSAALGRHLSRGGAGFALNRPPGHHASRAKAEGFCFINNMAVTLETLRLEHPEARFLVVDFDVHHGNGVQNIYIEDSSVYYYSIHGSPLELYPGTGFESERGIGRGEGFTRNVTVSRGASGEEWLKIFKQGLEAALLDSIPDFLLVCAGFDAHTEDPFGFVRVEDGHYQTVLRLLHETAAHHCQGRLGFTLEGGYSTEVLSRLVPNYIQETAAWKAALLG